MPSSSSSKQLGFFFFDVEAVSTTVPQTERQDSYHPWHAWNPTSQEDTRGCQRGGYFLRREDRPWNPGINVNYAVSNACVSWHCFPLVDLQIRLLQDAGSHDLNAIHTPCAPLPLRGRHHKWCEHLKGPLWKTLTKRPTCIQHLSQPVFF